MNSNFQNRRTFQFTNYQTPSQRESQTDFFDPRVVSTKGPVGNYHLVFKTFPNVGGDRGWSRIHINKVDDGSSP